MAHQLQPNYDHLPIYYPDLRSTLEIGSFVLVLEAPLDEKPLVCQLLRLSSRSSEEVELRVLQQTSRCPITAGLGRCLKEVILTNRIISLPLSRIQELAWVLTLNKLEELAAVLQGLSNIFLVRFDETGETVVSSYHEGDEATTFYCFPCEHAKCPTVKSLSLRLYEDCERIRDTLSFVLNRKSELQGDFARVLKHTFCSPEFWLFIKLKLVVSGRMTCHQPIKLSSKCRLRLTHQMKRVKLRHHISYELLRFEEEEHLSFFRQLFGETSTYGIRGNRPTIGKEIVIRENDTLNHVNVASLLDSEDAFIVIPPSTRQGIDLIFRSDSTISIRVRYEKLFYQSSQPDIPTHLRGLLEEYQWGPFGDNNTTNTSSTNTTINEDDVFDWGVLNKEAYQVTGKSGDVVYARNFVTGDEIEIQGVDRQRVLDKIRNKNML
jgi:hypothetical protein